MGRLKLLSSNGSPFTVDPIPFSIRFSSHRDVSKNCKGKTFQSLRPLPPTAGHGGRRLQKHAMRNQHLSPFNVFQQILRKELRSRYRTRRPNCRGPLLAMHVRSAAIGVARCVTCRNLIFFLASVVVDITQKEVLDIQDLDLPYDTRYMYIVSILLYDLYNLQVPKSSCNILTPPMNRPLGFNIGVRRNTFTGRNHSLKKNRMSSADMYMHVRHGCEVPNVGLPLRT